MDADQELSARFLHRIPRFACWVSGQWVNEESRQVFDSDVNGEVGP